MGSPLCTRDARMYRFLKALGETFATLVHRDFAFDGSSTPWRLGWTNAEQRAETLLVAILSPEQRVQYLAAGHFEVVGCHTGRRYRILRSSQMKVEQLDRSGRRAALLCFVPETPLPVGDVMLAQKFALELYERDALASRSGVRIAWSRRFAPLEQSRSSPAIAGELQGMPVDRRPSMLDVAVASHATGSR
jgi:hypothetical protein